MTPLIALLAIACASAPTPTTRATDGAPAGAAPGAPVAATAPTDDAAEADRAPSAAFPAAAAPASMAAWSAAPPPEIAAAALPASALVTRGLALREAGDLSGARQLFEAAARLAPGDSAAALELARTLVSMRAAGPQAICGMGASYEAIFQSLGAALAADPGLRGSLVDDPLLQPLLPLHRFRALLGVDTSRSPGADGLIVYGPPSGVWGSTRKLALLSNGRAALAEIAVQTDGSRSWTYQAAAWSAADGGWSVTAGDAAWTLQTSEAGRFVGPDGAWSDAASECGA